MKTNSSSQQTFLLILGFLGMTLFGINWHLAMATAKKST